MSQYFSSITYFGIKLTPPFTLPSCFLFLLHKPLRQSFFKLSSPLTLPTTPQLTTHHYPPQYTLSTPSHIIHSPPHSAHSPPHTPLPL